MIRRPADLFFRAIPALVCALISVYLAWNAGALQEQLFVISYELVPHKLVSIFFLTLLTGLSFWLSYFIWSRHLRRGATVEDWILASPEFLVAALIAVCWGRAVLAWTGGPAG